MVGKADEIVKWLFDQDKGKEFEIKEKKKGRSLNANNYCWELLKQLSEKMNISSIDLYRKYIKDLSIYRTVTLKKEACETFKIAWERQGTGWITKAVESNEEEETILFYYGSSSYNTKQMARLIDNIVQDCKALGIPTKEDLEIERLIKEWDKNGNSHRQH